MRLLLAVRPGSKAGRSFIRSTTGAISVILSVLFGCGVWSDALAAVPPGLLENLASPDYAARENAQKELVDWAMRHPAEAERELVSVARDHPIAEVRIRSLAALRPLARTQYDASGEGYMGIRMRDDFVVVPGGPKAPVPVVVVSEVMPDSAAAAADLRVDDVILSMNGTGWKAHEGEGSALLECMERIKATKPGSQVRFSVLRDGKAIDISVTLARRPAALNAPFTIPSQREIDEVEAAQRELHFKKWLLERKDH